MFPAGQGFDDWQNTSKPALQFLNHTQSAVKYRIYFLELLVFLTFTVQVLTEKLKVKQRKERDWNQNPSTNKLSWEEFQNVVNTKRIKLQKPQAKFWKHTLQTDLSLLCWFSQDVQQTYIKCICVLDPGL